MWRKLLLLCDAAKFVEQQEQDSRTELQEHDTSVKKWQPQIIDEIKPTVKLEETYKTKTEASIDITAVPNRFFTDYFENISDGLCRRFKYRCTFSPTCSEVIESYGNERKGVLEMKKHLLCHHFLKDSLNNIEKRMKQDNNKISCDKTKFLNFIKSKRCSINEAVKDSLELSKDLNTVKSSEHVPQSASNRIESILQQSTLLDTNFETNESTNLSSDMNAVVLKQLKHDYAKTIDADQLSYTSLVETEPYKKKQRKIDNTSDEFDLNRYLNGELFFVPPIIHIPCFPFVYTPCPLEPTQIVELDTNGDPVNLMKPIDLQLSTSRISSKKLMKKRKRRLVNKKRPVLRSVENCVACTSKVSSGPDDYILQDDAIENRENFNSMQ